MEQIELTKQTISRLRIGFNSKLLWVLLIAMLSTANSFGQISDIVWNGDPQIGKDVIPVEGKSATLEFAFSSRIDLNEVSVEITFPEGIEYVEESISPSTANVDKRNDDGKQIIAISLGEIKKDVEQNLKMEIIAKSGAEEKDNIATIVVKENSTQVGNAKEFFINAKLPSILMYTDTGEDRKIFTDTNAKEEYKINVSSSGANADNFVIELTVDEYTELQEFKWNDSPLIKDDNYTITTVTEGKLYTIPLTDLIKDADASKLVFKASSLTPANREINGIAKYPNAEEGYLPSNGIRLYMLYTALSGKPSIVHNGLGEANQYYVRKLGGGKESKIDKEKLFSEEEHVIYARIEFVNEGQGPAQKIKFSGNHYGGWGNTDIGEIYYSIDHKIGDDPKNLKGIIGKWRKDNRTYGYLSSQESKYYSFEGSLPDTEIVPAGKSLVFWVKVEYDPNMYDANDKKDIFTDYGNVAINGYVLNITSCESVLGEAGSVLQKSWAIQYDGSPHFREIPPLRTYDNTDQVTEMIRFGFVNAILDSKFDIEIELPDWLDIFETPVWENETEGTVPIEPETISNDETGTNRYRFSSRRWGSSSIRFTFKVKENQEGNRQDQITYKVHYLTDGKVVEVPCVSQVIQTVYLLAKPEHITSKFDIKRKTTGYKDSKNMRMPEISNREVNPGDLVRAERAGESDDIFHTYYMQGDKGEWIWKVKVLGDNYAKNATIFHLLQFKEGNNFNLDNLRCDNKLNIVVNEKNVEANVSEIGSKELRIEYSGDFPDETEFIVKLPFEVIKATNVPGSIETKTYITDKTSKPTFEKANDCKGVDWYGTTFNTYTLKPLFFGFGGDARSVAFSNNDYKTFKGIYIDVLHSEYLSSPYFKNEARILALPKEAVIILPKGYELSGDGGNKTTQAYRSDDRNNLSEEITIREHPYDNDSTMYTISFEDVFDLSQRYDPSQEQVVVPFPESNHLAFPDDRWKMDFDLSIKALKNAPPNSTMRMIASYTDEFKNSIDDYSEEIVKLSYAGKSLELNVNATPKTIPGKTVSVSMDISNQTDVLCKNVWLFVQGDITGPYLLEGIKLEEGQYYEKGESEDSKKGVWIKLSAIDKGEKVYYDLQFQHNSDERNNFDVTIYPVTDYGTEKIEINGEVEDFGINATTNIRHISGSNQGMSRTITFEPQQAQVSGRLESYKADGSGVESKLSFGQVFVLKATLSAANGGGNLYDAQMDIKIPEGYTFTGELEENAVKFNGTPFQLTDAMKQALESSGGYELSFKANDYLAQVAEEYLFGSINLTSENIGKREISLELQLTPDCDFSSANSITGKIVGKNHYGKDASGNGSELKLRRMLVDNDANFDIGVKTTFVPADKVFYENGAEKELEVTLTKLNTNYPIDKTIHLELQVPEVLDIEREIKYSGVTSGTITPEKKEPVANVRTIILTIPYEGGELNDVGNSVTYTIPLKYTRPQKKEDPESLYQKLITTPIQPIEASVMVLTKFGGDECGNEATTPLTLATTRDHVAFVFFNEDEMKVFADDPKELKLENETIRGSFYYDGAWTKEEDNSVLLDLKSNVYNDDYKDNNSNSIENGATINLPVKIYNVSDIGAVEMGEITYSYKVFPSLKFEYQVPGSPQCGSYNLSWSTLYLSSTSKHTAVRVYSDEDCNNIVLNDNTETITLPPGEHTYYIKASNNGGESDVEVIKITVEQKTEIIGVTGYSVVEGQPIEIIVDAVGKGNLKYIWQILEGGKYVDIEDENDSRYLITPSSSIAADHGKSYCVIVESDAGTDCKRAMYEFTLNVTSDDNPGTNPPSPADCRVTWDVSGNGSIMVSANGRAIGNGDRLSGGTVIQVQTTAYGKDVLTSLTANGEPFEGSYTLYGRDVHIVAEFTGTDPNPDSNAEVSDGTRIWTEKGYVCLYTEQPSMVQIITLDGRLLKQQKLSEGETRILLTDGFYIAILNGQRQKIAIRNY